MCLDPMSMIGLAGAAVSGIGGAMQAQNQAKQSEMQANAVERDAEATKKASAYEAARTREVVARTLGSQSAGIASNGVAFSGSAIDVMMDTATEGDLDVEAIKWNSKVKTDGMKYEAMQHRSNAASASAAAPIAFLSPIIGGIGKFGGSFG